MITTLGERASVLVEWAVVNVGAAVQSIARAARAKSEAERLKHWQRVALQARKAQRQLRDLELHALERAREAGLRWATKKKTG